MISHDLLLISIGPPSPARAQDGNLFLVPAESWAVCKLL
jgi:hypothetical protein